MFIMGSTDISKYLTRIKYEGPLTPTLETLAHLQQTHLLHVPFENLDIHRHVPIDLTQSFNKIVTMNRGGFCYELNGLFYELLREIGFDVKRVSAQVYDAQKGFGPPFDHMAIIARIDQEEYLVDVGFGEFAFLPIKIEPHKEHIDPRGIFIVEPFDENYIVVKKKNDSGEFIPEYIFTETPHEAEAFYAMCLHHQTSPDSHFTQKRICSLPTPDGRISLAGHHLKIRTNGVEQVRELKSEKEVAEVLWTYFGIVL